MTKTQYRFESKYETIDGTKWASSKWYDSMKELKQNKYYDDEDSRIITRELEVITSEMIRAQLQAHFERNQREILDV